MVIRKGNLCVTKFDIMKKVLSILLLILSTTFPITPNESGRSPISRERTNNIVARHQKEQQILAKLTIEDSIAYHTLDSIPICSPINIQALQVSSDYGFRIHPVYGDRRKHLGLDLRAPAGTEIKCTANGVVEKVVMSKYGYGNQIVIRHADGYKTRYAHLKIISVNVGDSVSKNQIIGLLGRSGLTTGNHLHYEIIKDEKPIDPLFFTYQTKDERSIKNYISTLITLEYV